MKTPLTEIRDNLTAKGYMATIPANANYVKVMGFNGKYYKAKNSASNTITADLNRYPFINAAWNLKDTDGYHDFYCN